jgi:hypothetical protein
MAEFAVISRDGVEIAQANKAPKLPKPPKDNQPDAQTAQRLQVKQWSEELLASETQLATARREVEALFRSGGSKQLAEQAIRALIPAVSAAGHILRGTDGNSEAGGALARFIKGIAEADKIVGSYKAGPMGFVLNPLEWPGQIKRGQQLGLTMGYLEGAEKAFKVLKPDLLQWADRPEKKQPAPAPKKDVPKGTGSAVG